MIKIGVIVAMIFAAGLILGVAMGWSTPAPSRLGPWFVLASIGAALVLLVGIGVGLIPFVPK